MSEFTSEGSRAADEEVEHVQARPADDPAGLQHRDQDRRGAQAETESLPPTEEN